jgi:hypothetical protein
MIFCFYWLDYGFYWLGYAKQMPVRVISHDRVGRQQVGSYYWGWTRQRNAPEWKDFTKIAGHCGVASRNCVEFQVVASFGMLFGACMQKQP